jgi:hypothetical protein
MAYPNVFGEMFIQVLYSFLKSGFAVELQELFIYSG